MPVVSLLTGNHLCNNPRVIKAGTALANAGFDVHVLGGWHERGLKDRDVALLGTLPFTFIPVVDFTRATVAGALARDSCRAARKLADLAFLAFNLASSWQFGCAVNALLKAASNNDSALYVAHSEPALFAAEKLSLAGRRVGIDMEDWFSEDLPPQARLRRPVALIRQIEAGLLRDGSFSTCPSRTMSRELARQYDCRAPVVVYNAFPVYVRGLGEPNVDRRSRDLKSIHWVSQTLGPGRGLEDLLAALPSLRQQVEIHLRAHAPSGAEEWVRSRVPSGWNNLVFVHPPVTNDLLSSRIAEHDIGFAGEMLYSKSRDVTVTNKLLHYLSAGLAVVASETAGQWEIAQAAPHAISLYPSGDVSSLATRLNELLDSDERLAAAKRAAHHAAASTFALTRQEATLVDAVRAALNS